MITLINSGLFSVAKNSGKNNEDSVLAPKQLHNGFIMALADGVGSYKGAKEASQAAINYLNSLSECTSFDAETIFLDLKQKISNLSDTDLSLAKAATTLTFCILTDNGLSIGHIGDTRAYIKKGGKLIQLSKDHTQYQSLLDKKLYTKKELDSMGSTHTLTSALSRSVDLNYQFEHLPIHECIDMDGLINIYLMSDGAYYFWNKRPRFSNATLSKPTKFAASLERRIESQEAVDDYTLVAASFSFKKDENN